MPVFPRTLVEVEQHSAVVHDAWHFARRLWPDPPKPQAFKFGRGVRSNLSILPILPEKRHK
jgi:hypothetical protein